MQTNDTNAKQQIADKIKDNDNILVIVNANPSVDELSAALGLTMLINKLEKHGTAIFSGDIPPAINFLDPTKTFENTVDSLRDFIIALDKEKADHLRYKVEGDVVKIFITPYRTTITNTDLEFSQGDYNVELVIAINVANEADLDKALSAHGKILHDATVATIDLGGAKSGLGSIAWQDSSSSSYCEMITSFSELIKGGKNLLDEQTSTALLTGIVAATERFSNSKTSSRAMTIAAQLMAAGANQQLIATKLEEAEVINEQKPKMAEKRDDGSTDLDESKLTKLKKTIDPEPVKEKPEAGTLAIVHEKQGDIDAVADQVKREDQADAERIAEEQLAEQLTVPQAAVITPDHLEKEFVRETVKSEPEEPSLGGTLNATTEQAAEDKRREVARDKNKKILSHSGNTYIDDQPLFQAPLNAVNDAPDEPEVADIFDATPPATQGPMIVKPPVAPSPASEPVVQSPEPVVTTPVVPKAPTLAEIDAQARDRHADAMADVHAALGTEPVAETVAVPVLPPAPVGAPGGLPPLPDFSTLPQLPPLPNFALSTDPQMPVDTKPVTSTSDAFDPNQFQIPPAK